MTTKFGPAKTKKEPIDVRGVYAQFERFNLSGVEITRKRNLTTIQIQPIRKGNILFGMIILKQLPTDLSDNVREKLAPEIFQTFSTL